VCGGPLRKIRGGTLERDKIAYCRYGTTFSHSLGRLPISDIATAPDYEYTT
jgi:hypothetical protein